MSVLPRQLDKLDVPGFTMWLIDSGATMKAPTNEWEVVRYKRGTLTSILYRKATGALTYCGYTGEDYAKFLKVDLQKKPDDGLVFRASGKTGPGLPPGGFVRPTKSAPKPPRNMPRAPFTGKHSRSVRMSLIARDGAQCWYCGVFMPTNDRTLEHLIPRSQGGTNRQENLVLAHHKCNNKAGDKPFCAKVQLRNKLRKRLHPGAIIA